MQIRLLKSVASLFSGASINASHEILFILFFGIIGEFRPASILVIIKPALLLLFLDRIEEIGVTVVTSRRSMFYLEVRVRFGHQSEWV